MGKGKFLKTVSGEKRAQDLLDYHRTLLENSQRSFYKGKELCYFLKHNDDADEDGYVKMGYVQTKKLLSVTYNLELETVINNMEFPEDFELKLKFTGFPVIQAAYFRGTDKSSRRYENTFNNEKLLSEIMYYASKVEISHLKLKYRKRNRVMTVKASPYAGALLRLIFPPLFFKIPLKEYEMQAIWDILMVAREYAEQLK